jgi:CubicO group peptidase (beta-lactamase class C family)
MPTQGTLAYEMHEKSAEAEDAMRDSRPLFALRTYALAFAVVLSPAFLQIGDCQRGNTELSSLELEVDGGPNLITGFDTGIRSYDVSTSGSTVTVWAQAVYGVNDVSWQWLVGTTTIGSGPIGTGGGEVTLPVPIPDGQSVLRVAVKSNEVGATASGYYSIHIERVPTDTPESQGFDSDALASFIEGIEGLGVDSLLVVRNGVMVLDAYFYPYLGDRPHDVASVTKTVTSTLTGIAIDQGFLQGVDQRVMPVFAADYPDIPAVGGKEDITFEHLLTLTSGLDCGGSDGVSLLQMLSSADWVRHVLERDMINPPGTAYVYCSPAVHLLAAAAIEPSGQSALAFAEQYLFDPLGIDDTDWHWPTDPQGIVHGWGDLQLHPHAMARFGQMFLDQGMWNQTQVVSAAWVERATQPQPRRYLWWQPPVFENAYAAAGRGGQHIIVQPDRNLVVVATGSLDISLWWASDFLDTLVSDAALPPNPDAYQRLMTAVTEATMPPPPLDPVPALPPTAMDVSGRVYALDANQFGVGCYAVHFESANPSEATVDLTTLGQGGTFEEFSLPIGMDGVPRFSDTQPRGFQVGMVGEWATPDRLDLLYDELGGVTHLSVVSSFGASAANVTIDFIDRTGYFAPQSVSGYWVDTGICPY